MPGPALYVESFEDVTRELERLWAAFPVVRGSSLEAGVEGASLRATDGSNPVAGDYTWTAVGLADERLDVNASHASSGSDFTTHKEGWWLLAVFGCWSQHATGYRGVRLIDTSDSNRVLVADECQAAPATVWTQHGHALVRYIDAEHVLRFQAQQNSGNAGGLPHKQSTTGSDGSGFDAIYLGRGL